MLALTYSIVVLVAWGVGAYRRIVDTKTFAKIYAELAVPVIIKQKEQGEEVSTIATRVALSREFVDFFEEHLPMFITSVASVLGAVFMLLFIEFWIGVLSFVILFVFVLMLPKFTKKTDEIYFQLNNQLEKEVEHIEKSDINTLNHHYGIIARLRISISNREALNYLLIGFLVCLLFTFGIVVMIINNTQDAGHIYSVMTYLWMFAISLDDSPRLMEQFSKLNDIGKRIHIE